MSCWRAYRGIEWCLCLGAGSLLGYLHANFTLLSVCSSFYLTNWTDLSLSKADKSQAQSFPYQRSSSAVHTNLFHVWRGVQKCTNTWEETRASSNACRNKACVSLSHTYSSLPDTNRCLSIHHSSWFCLHVCSSPTDINTHIFQGVTQGL